VQCDHPDLTAIRIWTAELQILVFSVYIPPVPMHNPDGTSAETTLSAIHHTIQENTQNNRRPTCLILSGDFNRHHPAWGNNNIQPRFVEEAGELINFFHEHGLQGCLPRGVSTYWSLSHPGRRSTIDQTVTDKSELLLKCHLYHDNYGSDHRATYSEWSLQIHRTNNKPPRKAYDRADWGKIGNEVISLMRKQTEMHSTHALDMAVENLTKSTAIAVDRYTPDQRPSPYAKRWFTADLKEQQNKVNRLRRRWQARCAEAGRNDPYSMALFQDMRQSRRAWTRTIEEAKASHWKQFLDEAGEGKLWKAASYMKPREAWGCVPTLRVGDREVTDNPEKAQAFMDAFFPSMAPAEDEQLPRPPAEIPWQPISEIEIYRSLSTAKPSTAPGEDGLPMLVWKRLWDYLGSIITKIFTVSIELGYHPQRWRCAQIVVLRKPGKPDYSQPGAYRPISLLNTLGKLLEAVVARRLSFYAEHYGLLPDTQFGGRPGRTTEQALLVLANAIDKAWYKQKVVTLVAFDLKGAFNGVNQTSLDARLQSKGIPLVARRWIASFMTGRQASIRFDDYQTEIAPLDNAGLAQGSPLSPILFTLFNNDLVDQPVDSKGGASAFIDDYFRWRVGWSAEENLARIQLEDIPRIEAWARRTGSCFAAEKTELIHITRKRKEQCQGELIMNGKAIKPSTTAKLLGIIFDHELRWKPHVQQAVKRATKVNLALGGLRHLRPEQMRQLYEACVAPVIDYASTVWHDPLRDKTHLRHLRTVQRTALIRVLSAFRTVATAALDVEAHVRPIHLRLRFRAQNTITRLHTLPQKHPIWSTLLRAQRRRDNIGSYARFPLAEALKTMNLERLREIEMIDPTPLPPWRPEVFARIEIEPDREVAIEKAEAVRSISDVTIYSDASGRQGHLGAAAVAIDERQQTTDRIQIQVGSMDRWSVHAAELIGILYAINIINKIAVRRWTASHARVRSATIFSDSMSALQAIRRPGNKSGQQIIHAILRAAENTKNHGTMIRLQWIPGHCEIPGNEIADQLAKEAAIPSKTHPFSPLISRERAHIRQVIQDQWAEEWKGSKTGSHLRRIDNTLPAKYTRGLYGSLPRNRAYLLTQLRTGHCWLSTYAKTFRFRDNDLCICGERESVSHVLLDCPELRALRRELREKVGEAFNSISTLLGGSGGEERGKVSHASRAKTVEAVLDFAEASQRFQSRVP
jgi:ribonuclease HI